MPDTLKDAAQEVTKAPADNSDPAAQESQAPSEIKRQVKLVSAALDVMKDPMEAIARYGSAEKYIEYDKALTEAEAEKTGGSFDQIENLASRTDEQQRAMIEISTQEMFNRMEKLSQSNYMRAIDEVISIQRKNDLLTYTDDGFGVIPMYTALYYFATHPDREVTKSADLTPEELEEIRNIFRRIDDFFRKHDVTEETAAKAYLEFIEAEAQQIAKSEPRKQTRAERHGAIMTIGNRLFVPTDPEYQNAFMTSTGKAPGFYRIEGSVKKRQLALDVNPEFMRGLAQAVWISFLNGDMEASKVYFPDFLKELGIDVNQKAVATKESTMTRAEARAAFCRMAILELNNIWGSLPRDSREYPLISAQYYDPTTEEFSFTSPYLQALVGGLAAKEKQELNSGKKYFYWNCDLLHATAANERNKAAVEMATRVLVGLQQRGTRPDCKLKQNRGRAYKDESQITYTINCAGLIKDCTQIRERLKKEKTASGKTKLLTRCFSAMYRILREKTDIFEYYTNLTIFEVMPTTKTLTQAEIVITHHGSSPKYKKQPLPLKGIGDDTEPAEN